MEEEGVLIDNFTLVEGGHFRERETLDLLASGPYPARNPAQNLADLKAQIAANEKGVQELRRMIGHFGLDVNEGLGLVEQIRDGQEVITIAKCNLTVGDDDGVYLMQHSPILHLFATNMDRAMEVRQYARQAGCKESGIRSVRNDRVVVEVRCTEHMQMPLGWGRAMITDTDHLHRCVVLANELLERAQGKYRAFFQTLV